MGGCGSREKELREKVGFSQSDYDYAIKKFVKMTKTKTRGFINFITGKQMNILVLKEIPVFAQKLYIFMRNYGGQNYVDSLTFLTVVDLLTRVSLKLQSQLKNLDIYALFTLISLSCPDIMQRDTFNLNNVYKISVSYSNAVKLFKELINMQSDKGDILCHDDDQAPILIINNIFENHSLLNYKAFNDKIKLETPLISKIIKNYIAGKFINKDLRNQLPKLNPSELMNKQLIALLNLSVPWFQKCISINQIYKYEVDSGQQYNFNILGNCLLQAKGPIPKQIKMKKKKRNTYLDIFLLLNGEFLLIFQVIKDHLYSLSILNLKYSQLMVNSKVNLLYLFQLLQKAKAKHCIHHLDKVQNNLIQVQEAVDMIIIEFGQILNNSKQVELLKKTKHFKVVQYYLKIYIY